VYKMKNCFKVFVTRLSNTSLIGWIFHILIPGLLYVLFLLSDAMGQIGKFVTHMYVPIEIEGIDNFIGYFLIIVFAVLLGILNYILNIFLWSGYMSESHHIKYCKQNAYGEKIEYNEKLNHMSRLFVQFCILYLTAWILSSILYPSHIKNLVLDIITFIIFIILLSFFLSSNPIGDEKDVVQEYEQVYSHIMRKTKKNNIIAWDEIAIFMKNCELPLLTIWLCNIEQMPIPFPFIILFILLIVSITIAIFYINEKICISVWKEYKYLQDTQN